MYSSVSAFSHRVDDTVAILEQPMFYSKKIRTARDLRQHLVYRKALEPCAKGFWNRKFSVDLDKVVYLHRQSWTYAYLQLEPTPVTIC